MNNNTFIELLKETRAGRKISPEKVFDDIHMPVKFLHAIENGQWSEFPSETHIKGYLRLYSSYLKIDSAAVENYLYELLVKEKEEKIENGGGRKNENGAEEHFFSVAEKKKISLLLVLSAIFIILFILVLHLLPE